MADSKTAETGDKAVEEAKKQTQLEEETKHFIDIVNQTTEHLDQTRESPARDELKTEEEKRAHDEKARGTDYRDTSGKLKTGFPPTDSRGRRLAISGVPGAVSGGEAIDKWLAGAEENIDGGENVGGDEVDDGKENKK